MIVIRDPKNFCFNFDWPKDVDEKKQWSNESNLKSIESLAKNKIKIRMDNYC